MRLAGTDEAGMRRATPHGTAISLHTASTLRQTLYVSDATFDAM
jgi:hypothetical protein